MITHFARIGLLLVAILSLTTACGRVSHANDLVPIGAGLKGPDGMTATVYASGLEHQSAYALDAKGRLWVATSGATTHADDANGSFRRRAPTRCRSSARSRALSA